MIINRILEPDEYVLRGDQAQNPQDEREWIDIDASFINEHNPKASDIGAPARRFE